MVGVEPESQAWGWALTLGAALCWSAFDVARKRLVAAIAPLPLTVALALAQIPLFLLWALLDGAAPPEPSAYLVPGVVVLAANSGASVLFFWSLARADLGRAVPMLSLTPAWSALLAAFWLGEQPPLTAWVGIALVVVAAVLLALRRDGSVRGWDPGTLAMGMVALFWAITSVGDKAAIAVCPGAWHATVQTAALAVLLGGLTVLRGQARSMLPTRPLWSIFALGTVVSVAALGLQLGALLHLHVGVMEAGKRAFGMVAAVLLGRLVFGERPGWREAVAVGLMIPGVWLLGA